MPSAAPLALGLDFGTESVRALLVDLKGAQRGSAVARFRHGQIIEKLPGSGERLPADFALQHPQDWIDAAARAVRAARRQAKLDARRIISIGVDFTSCTMLPTQSDGRPLCQTKHFAREKFAWPKLWKHHGAVRQTERMNAAARRRKEKWLDRYGGIIGLEWLFPKILETLEEAPSVYAAADVWLEAGDWFVWQLVGGGAKSLPRSTCQAGYKALWNANDGYPSPAFFKALDDRMTHVVRDKMPGRLLAPGETAGELLPSMAKRLGLPSGIAVSAATIDAHAGVPGAGVAEAGTLVMVLGTSSCHMLNADCDAIIPGVAGVVEGGILPGMFGIETGQAAVGDGFDWLRRLSGQRDFKRLDRLAAELPPGADGVLCLDWLNGCRTPLMDGSLRGALTGLSLAHRAEHLYRAMIEASAFGVRWIVELLEAGGVPVKRLVATGGLPHHNPLLVQIYADVLGKQILVHPSQQGPALGAAILGVLAAGHRTTGFRSAAAAIRAMARADGSTRRRTGRVVKPRRANRKTYDKLYDAYRILAEQQSR
ncbi:MAG: ribulokinase [Planctomycetes bacterium]|nr:ribulokinase [Planctomycetota bacterium]